MQSRERDPDYAIVVRSVYCEMRSKAKKGQNFQLVYNDKPKNNHKVGHICLHPYSDTVTYENMQKDKRISVQRITEKL